MSYQNFHLMLDRLIAAVWLACLAVINHTDHLAVLSIFPYLIPVGVVAWRHGLLWGFVFAALGALVAMPGDYPQSHSRDELFWAAFTTYLKLSTSAAGIVIGKIVHKHYKENP